MTVKGASHFRSFYEVDTGSVGEVPLGNGSLIDVVLVKNITLNVGKTTAGVLRLPMFTHDCLCKKDIHTNI